VVNVSINDSFEEVVRNSYVTTVKRQSIQTGGILRVSMRGDPLDSEFATEQLSRRGPLTWNDIESCFTVTVVVKVNRSSGA